MRRPWLRASSRSTPHRPGELQDEVGDLGEVVLQPRAIDRRLAKTGAQRVVVGAQAVEQRVELVEVREVADADRAAADLVLVGRADAAAGGADLARAAGILAQRIEVAVDGEDQRAGFGDAQHVGLDPHALAAQLLDFVAQRTTDRAPRHCR